MAPSRTVVACNRKPVVVCETADAAYVLLRVVLLVVAVIVAVVPNDNGAVGTLLPLCWDGGGGDKRR